MEMTKVDLMVEMKVYYLVVLLVALSVDYLVV